MKGGRLSFFLRSLFFCFLLNSQRNGEDISMFASCFLSKKSLCLALTLALLVSGVIAAFPEDTAGRANEIKVGLIAGSDNLMDGSFNEMAYAGLLRARDDFGIEENVYLSADGDAIVANLAECVADGNALCIMIGYTGGEPTYNAALANPSTQFAVLDFSYEDYPPNLQGAVFASEEAAYLAGTLAGKMTESNLLGLIGGMDISPVNDFLCGFEQGALDINPEVTTLWTYLDTFVDQDAGAAAAQEMLDEGADVIFPAAGPAGTGALFTAAQAGAWVVGVDVDQYMSVFGGGTQPGAAQMLTSAMKRLDNVVFQIISETISENFVPGTVKYDLAVEGVGLAPYHAADAAIPGDAKAAVEAARAGLLDGSIDPLRSCRWHDVYLPFLNQDHQP
jgi:basic membrane protein A and related proteins